MLSCNTRLLAAATLLISAVSAQSTYYIVPDSVPIGTRRSWCITQESSCPLLCLQNTGDSSSTASNYCEAETLAYECICGNGLTPNLTEYSQTIPYFTCTEYGTQCVNSCGGNSDCAYNCRANNRCGATDPKRVNITTTSSSISKPTSTSDDSTQVQNGFADQASTTSSSSSSNNESNGGSKSGSNMAVDLGRSYGLAVVFTGIFAGFALVL